MNEKKSMNRTIVLTEEQINELPSKLYTSFTQGKNQIINNTFENVNNDIPDEYFDLIILDPPYNLTKQYSTSTFKQMSDDEYLMYIYEILKNCLRVLKPTGTLYICGDWKSSFTYYLALRELNKNNIPNHVINRITWARDKGRGALNNWKNNLEDIYMVVKDKNNYTFNVEDVKLKRKVLAPYKDKNGNNKDWETTEEGNVRMTYPSNIWFDITVPFWSMSENTNHPTHKSEKLFAKLILASSNEGDKIYEPFAGVCTAGVVANKLNRNYTCVESEEEYCLLGQFRIEKSNFDKTIQGYENKVFTYKGNE